MKKKLAVVEGSGVVEKTVLTVVVRGVGFIVVKKKSIFFSVRKINLVTKLSNSKKKKLLISNSDGGAVL